MSNLFADYLRATAAVPATEWEFLVPFLQVRLLAKHETWLPAGQVARHLAFVEEGVLRSFLPAAEQEATNNFFLAGSVASSLTSSLTQKPAAWAVEALTASRLVCFPYKLLPTLYARHPCWLHWKCHLLEEQFLLKCRRETAFLRASAAERYQALRQQYPMLEQLVAQRYLASYLGIAPETLSRLRALPTPQPAPFS